VLADRFGSKTLLLLSFASSALCYLLQANADSMAMLYLSQIPTVFQHAFMGATAFITGRTGAKERPHMLGYNSVAYGVGMLFGPALGGWLGKTDLATSAWIAAAGSLVSCVSSKRNYPSLPRPIPPPPLPSSLVLDRVSPDALSV
jgi:MFS family permease